MANPLKPLDPRPAIKLLVSRRALIWRFFVYNLTVRYHGTVLGMLWIFAQPLLLLCVYTIVFTYIFHGRRFGTNEQINQSLGGFALMIFCGMSVYNIFAEGVNNSANSIFTKPNFVKKVIFPLEVLPISKVLSSAAFCCAWLLLCGTLGMIIFHTVSWTMLLIPVILIPVVLLSMGTALFVSSTTVYIRDMIPMVKLLIQAMFYLTPVLYPGDIIPEKYRWILKLHPMAAAVDNGRKLFMLGEMPDWSQIGCLTVESVLVFLFGFYWFGKLKRGFADVM